MRIAFIGHSFHQRTRSSGFFVEELGSIGKVSCFWDEAGLASENISISSIVRSGFDLIVLWQVEKYAPLLARSGHPNVIFVPMYDGCKDMPDVFWRACLGLKLLAFSSTLYEKLQRFGLTTEYFQYFPNPDDFPEIETGDGLRGFFWQRKQDISWRTIKPLLEGKPWKKIAVHGQMDPEGGKFIRPTGEDISRFGIEFLDWFPEKSDFLVHLRQCNVYFCSRLEEGIGMAFLEAMAMGMVVVAPRRPTMTEYIVDGWNGVLYEPDAVKPVDWEAIEVMGRTARYSVQQGYAVWRRDHARLIDFVLTPMTALERIGKHTPRWFEEPPRRATGCPSLALEGAGEAALSGGLRNKGLHKSGSPRQPLITIATVVLNGCAVLEGTLRSAVGQSYRNKEIIVLDGLSTDGTVDILRAYDDVLDFWQSAPDEGAYDAMNKAAALARGDWILFLNAGDWFKSDDVIGRVFSRLPDDVDFVYGHHVYLTVDGIRAIHRAALFDRTWDRLRKGAIEGDWLAGMPGHQATFTRTEFLRRNPYDTRYRIAADHELLFRARQQGARFFHSNVLISTYAGGGLSWANFDRCMAEWETLGKKFSADPARVARYYNWMRLGTELEGSRGNRWAGRVARRFLRNPIAFLKTLRLLGFKRLAGRMHQLLFTRGGRRIFDLRASNRFWGPTYQLAYTTEGKTVWLFNHGSPWEFTGYLEGFSAPEPWGGWMQGPSARITSIPAAGPRVEFAVEIVRVHVQAVGKTIRLLAGDCSIDYTLKHGKQTLRGVIEAGSEFDSLHLEVSPSLSSFTSSQTESTGVGGVVGIRRIRMNTVR